jgi:hypothetical protein
MSDFGKSSRYRIRGGFLVRPETAADFTPARARALDARRRSFSPGDEGEDDPDQNTVEIHNLSGEPEHSSVSLTGDDEEGEGEEGEEVARFPANKYHFATEGDEVVVYRGAGTPKHKTDIFDFEAGDSRSRARDGHPNPPRTLAQLNAANAAFYRAKAGRR